MKFSFFIFILYFICFLKGEIINNPVKTNKESNPINYIILYKSPTATIQTTQTQIAQPDVVPVQTNAQPVAQPAAPAAPATPVAAPAAQPAAQPQQPGVTPQVVAAASINKLSE